MGCLLKIVLGKTAYIRTQLYQPRFVEYSRIVMIEKQNFTEWICSHNRLVKTELGQLSLPLGKLDR